MYSLNYELLVGRLAAACPARGVASALEGRFSALLRAAEIYLSPSLYSRFSVSLIVYPVVFQILALLLLPPSQALLILASIGIVQSIPFLLPLTRAYARRRAIEAELPFLLIFLSIFSRDSSPTIDEGLRKVAELGDGVLPAFRKESAIMERDLAFAPGTPVAVLEKTFIVHPSKSLKQLVHGLLTTLSTGRSVVEYVEGESLRQVELMEAGWKRFSQSVGSLAEVSLMVLALFPVGLDLFAAAIPGLASAEILLVSLALLGLFSGVLIMVIDATQPVLYDARPPLYPFLLSIGVWSASTAAYVLGLLPIQLSLVPPIVASTIGFLQTRRVHDKIRMGEEEASALLHDLAEESKAGVSLPEALSRASEGSRFTSISGPLATFHQSLLLGLSPAEASKKVSHPSWLVRLALGTLSVAFVTGAGYEKLERLSSFFARLSDARRDASRSLLPFLMVGVIVPGISIAAMSFLSTFNQGGIPFLPSFSEVSQNYILVSISAVSLMTGLILSKLYTQTTRHGIALPIMLSSTLVSLVILSIF